MYLFYIDVTKCKCVSSTWYLTIILYYITLNYIILYYFHIYIYTVCQLFRKGPMCFSLFVGSTWSPATLQKTRTRFQCWMSWGEWLVHTILASVIVAFLPSCTWERKHRIKYLGKNTMAKRYDLKEDHIAPTKRYKSSPMFSAPQNSQSQPLLLHQPVSHSSSLAHLDPLTRNHHVPPWHGHHHSGPP